MNPKLKRKKNTKNQKNPKTRKRNVKIGTGGKIRNVETEVDGVGMIMIYRNNCRPF